MSGNVPLPFRGQLINKHGVKQVELIEIMCKDRRDELRHLTRERLSSLSRSIEVKAFMMLLERSSQPDPDRPYGLPSSWSESGRDKIWECILKFVEEPQDVINLSETCILFQRLLKEKYQAARLTEIVEVCVRKKALPPEVLLDLRRVSRTAKNAVDVDKGVMPGKVEEIFGCLSCLIPGVSLKVKAIEVDQNHRLHRILSSFEEQNAPSGTFPLKELFLNEDNGLNLPLLRDSIRRLLERVGESIQTLMYISEQNSHDTYNLLRRWVPLLPNLKDLIVGVRPSENVNVIKPFEPFLRVPKLKRYCEMLDYGTFVGFSLCHVCAILEANPALQFVALSSTPEDRINSIIAEGFLDQHQLEMFVHESKSSLVPFLESQVHWPLTRLHIIQSEKGIGIPIAARTFVEFVNQFGATLKQLKALVALSDLCTCETGGLTMINLPNLMHLQWWLETDSECLSFMLPMKKMEYLDLFVPRILRSEETLDYLETYHIPKLYPALRRIRVTEQIDSYEEDGMHTVWESGSAILQ